MCKTIKTVDIHTTITKADDYHTEGKLALGRKRKTDYQKTVLTGRKY
jgi:hypothetical protein